MSNYHLLSQTKLAKMADDYLTSIVQEKPFSSKNNGCMVQIISTNPFEISDSSHHIYVRDPSKILESLKKVNSNLTMLSIKGALISLQEWRFESRFIPSKNEIKFDIIIEKIEYIDGIGTTELVMDTIPILEVISLKNKFKRLKKFFISKDFEGLHPVENSLELIEKETYYVSETIKKNDNQVDKEIKSTIESQNDPFLIWDPTQHSTKSSVTKSQISEFDVLSITSDNKRKYGNMQFKPVQSITTNPFEIQFDLLSSKPLIQKFQIEEEYRSNNPEEEEENGNREDKVKEKEEACEDSERLSEFNKTHEDFEDIEVRPKKLLAKNSNTGEISERSNEEEENDQQSQEGLLANLAKNTHKRSFDDMMKFNVNAEQEMSHPDLKKFKYQWGLNHQTAQDEFRRSLQARKSKDVIPSQTDILDLLASSQLFAQYRTNPKEKGVIDLEGTRMEEEAPLEEKKTICIKNKNKNQKIVEEFEEVSNLRRLSTPTLGPKKMKKTESSVEKKPVYSIPVQEKPTYSIQVQEKKPVYSIQAQERPAHSKQAQEVSKPTTKPALLAKPKETERPWSFGKPSASESLSDSFQWFEGSNSKEVERRKKVQNSERIRDHREEFKSIEGKENDFSYPKSKNIIDLTREENVIKERQRTNASGLNNKNQPQGNSNSFLKANQFMDFSGFQDLSFPRRDKKQTAVRTVENPFDRTKSINLSEFQDILVKPKKKVQGYGGK